MKTKKKIKVLKAIRMLLLNPNRWTKGTPARNKYGNIVDPRDTDAAQWCLIGAGKFVADQFDLNSREIKHILADMVVRNGGSQDFVGTFNDRHTHDEIMEVLESEIQRLKAENGKTTSN